ncbi:MAG: response regulator [Methanoregula sp.]
MTGALRVLIASGDATAADNLAHQVETAGYRVMARVTSGKEAVALAETRHPDLVLVDTKLRGKMSIPAVLKKIQTFCNIPVVVIASSDEDVPVLRRNALLPNGLLVRPFGIRQFRQVTRSTVYRHYPEAGLNQNGGDNQRYANQVMNRIAHDINNSLSSALANIQISRRSCITSDDILCEHLNSAEASVLRARDQSLQLLTPVAMPAKETRAPHKTKVLPERPQKVMAHKRGATMHYRILLMDDEPAILSATSEMLSFLGHEVTVAENGDTAITLYKQAQASAMPFDAVILDITVPGGKGAQETLPQLRTFDPEVRAIISTGYATHPLVVSFSASGFVAALVKPYGFKELEESLSKAFQS